MSFTVLLATINWNWLLSFVALCFTAMATLIAIYRKKIKPEDMPGQSVRCIQKMEEMKRIENTAEDAKERNENLKETVSQIQTEIATIQEHNKYASKSIDEMKQDNKLIVKRLDDLLKQLMDFLSH